MFSHEGTARSARQNRVLAGVLATVGGYANAVGFVVIGTFTSHATGNVGRFANEIAAGRKTSALLALWMVLAFFAGAFIGSMILESKFFGHVSRAYAMALGLEGTFLLIFMLLTMGRRTSPPHALDTEGALLCAAMGIQNGLVTRLSGAVVRTTHLTGVITDLGIETARWFRYWRKTVADAAGISLVLGPNIAERPALEKIQLLGTIAISFTVGAVLGACASMTAGGIAMALAVLTVAFCSGYAVLNGRRHTAQAMQASRR
jgi:uncharacterized membrane protein YoaK (UPF0700 family)